MAHDASDVVEWGSDDEPRLAVVAARLRLKEHQLRQGIAGAGAAFAFLSLLTDWQSPFAVLDGGWPGTAYVVGLMVLYSMCTTILFGPPAGFRVHLRVAALGWTGALLGVLVATVARSRMAGVGVLLAIVGVGLLGLAIYLTGRTRPHPVPVEGPDETATGPVDLEVAPAKPFVHPGSLGPRD